MARSIASIDAHKMFNSSISLLSAKPVPVIAILRINVRAILRFLGDKRFESSIVPSILSEHKERLIITADATTGPANGPLPTSSTPAIRASLDKDRPSSKMNVGNGLTPLDLILFEESFSEVRPETVKMTCEILEKFGFGSYIMHILEDSVLDIQQTRNPCEQALLRIANNILESTEQNNFIVGKNTSIDEKMLEITGYSEQEILILLKELSRNYKATSDGWSS